MRATPIFILGLILLASYATAVQTTYLRPTKISTGDLSTDGNMTFNGTSMVLNNTGYCLAHWSSPIQGCLINSTLTAWRNWTLPDADGTVLLGPDPTIGDFTNAQHGHDDAADGGQLNAGNAFGAGTTMLRDNLPDEVAYEDELNTFTLVQTFSDGISVAVGDCVVFNTDSFLCRNGANSLNTTGAFTSGTLWSNGAFRANSTVTFDDFTSGSVPFFGASGLLSQDNANLFWDNTNDRLGVHIATPSFPIDVRLDLNTAGVKPVLAFQTNAAGFTTAGLRLGYNVNAGATDADAGVILSTGGMPLWLGVNGGQLSSIIITTGGFVTLAPSGGRVGFYGQTPVVQPSATLIPITDSTGGSAGNDCAAIAAGALYAQGDMTAIRNCLTRLISRINTLEAALGTASGNGLVP